MPEHYTTADGVDVTCGDTVYVVGEYTNTIHVRQVGDKRVCQRGAIPFKGSEQMPMLTFASKDSALLFLIARVELHIAAALQEAKSAEARAKRLRKLSLTLQAGRVKGTLGPPAPYVAAPAAAAEAAQGRGT